MNESFKNSFVEISELKQENKKLKQENSELKQRLKLYKKNWTPQKNLNFRLEMK